MINRLVPVIFLLLLVAAIGFGPIFASPVFAQQSKKDSGKNSENTARNSDDLRRALGFKPLQDDVDYDVPGNEEFKSCRLESADSIGKKGYVIFDGSGRLLRAYLDTNNDGKPDIWCYYREGVEIYRDIDSNFDEKADQYRWLGTAGIRWADDKNQDGKIDGWKMISAEEVSMEVVESVRNNDLRRFELLIITDQEIASLGLGKELSNDLSKRAANARAKFNDFVRSQNLIDKTSQWVHFGGTRPGFIPAGTNGSSKDVIIYDSVQAVVDTGNKHGQLAIGTLVNVDETWRMVELPEVIKEGMVISNGGTFFRSVVMNDAPITNGEGSGGVDESSQELYAKYVDLEAQLKTAKGGDLAKIHDQRARTLIEMAETTKSAQNRSNWIRQMADDVSGAYQNEEFPQGYEFLTQFAAKLKKEKVDATDIAYVSYRSLAAFYTKKLTSAQQKDYEKIEKEQVASLREYIEDFPKAMHVPDAMLQLALSAEFKDEIKEASDWYGRIADEFPSSPLARKAVGAKIRLNSEGEKISFGGKTIRGDNWNLSSEVGKVVLIHYWATWCEPCKQDINEIKRLHTKYGEDGLVIVGVSVDDDIGALQSYLRDERLPWTQLFEEGGQEGPLAEKLGIATWPTMLLIGKDGKVLNRNITSNELERAIQRAMRD